MLLVTNKEIAAIERAAKAARQRPPNERRHRLIEEIRATWPRRADGQVLPGLWDACVQACDEAGDAIEAPDGEGRADSLFRWYRQHCRDHCAVLN